MQKPIVESEYLKHGNVLHHSAFNTEWFAELGIVPSVIFDIGAYDFGDAIRFKDRFPKSQVFGFEMDFDNYDKFSPFASVCGINTYNYAVSDNCLPTPFYKSKHFQDVNAQSSLLSPSEEYKRRYGYVSHKHTGSSMVNSIRVDQFCALKYIDNIDFCNIDVEGAELRVLEGMGHIRPKLIWLEYLIDGGEVSFAAVDKWFIDRNYELVLTADYDKLWKLK